MAETKNFTYKEKDAGHKELFSMLIYRPISNFLLNRFFKHLNITANQISLLSLFIVIIGSGFFAFFAYPYIIFGLLFLHLGYVFDTLDGQYARYKGLSSKFGRWFDSFVDIIKIIFIFLSLSYRAYIVENNAAVFIWGFTALGHCFLASFALYTKEQFIKGPSFEAKIKKGIYIGWEISLYWVITFFVLINKLYAGLVFLAIAGALSWIKPYITFARYYKAHKDEIERD
ncbi:MAG: CDP-alcohol phosphatidyltransferase family protein [Candidatus Omnitrophota bacterium]